MPHLHPQGHSKLSPSKVTGPKAGPNGSFPIGDETHAKLAISGATRSEHAGNISASTADHIKAEARAKLKSLHDHADEVHPVKGRS